MKDNESRRTSGARPDGPGAGTASTKAGAGAPGQATHASPLDRWRELLIHPVRDPSLRRALRIAFGLAPVGYSVSILLLLLETALSLGAYYSVKLLIDSAAAGTDAVLSATLVSASIALAFVWVRGLSSWLIQNLGGQVGTHCDFLIHRHAASLGLPFFESPEYFNLLAQARQRGAHRVGQAMSNFAGLIRSGLMLTGILALLVSTHWIWLPVLFLISLPVFMVKLHFAEVGNREEKALIPNIRRANYLGDVITGTQSARDVRAFALGDYLLGQYASLRNDTQNRQQSIRRRRTLVETATQSATVIALFVCLAAIVYATARGRGTIGELALFIIAFQQAFSALQGVSSSISSLYENSLSVGSYFELLDLHGAEQAEASDPSAAEVEDGSGIGEIRFEGVSFRYPGAAHDTLTGIDLVLVPARMTVLVGLNGAGKTTLAKLLARLYEPTAGRITIDGVDARDIPIERYRRMIAVVFQDSFGFAMTAFENIAIGDVRRLRDEQRVRRIAADAQIDRMIESWPSGYDTPLGCLFEGSQELSGGQWQRFAWARLLYRDAQVLVLDEPTSALDGESEGHLMALLESLARDRIVLVISHRVTTIARADEVLVLIDGAIVERGTHAELLRSAERYRAIFPAVADSADATCT